jgi:hypothetical protein
MNAEKRGKPRRTVRYTEIFLEELRITMENLSG